MITIGWRNVSMAESGHVASAGPVRPGLVPMARRVASVDQACPPGLVHPDHPDHPKPSGPTSPTEGWRL